MKRRATLVLVKGNLDRQGESRRYYDALAVMQAAATALKGDLKVGANSAVLTLPVTSGDAPRVFGDVLSRVDIQRTETAEEALGMGERLLETADRVGCPREAFSMDAVRRHLDNMYMRYDVWSD